MNSLGCFCCSEQCRQQPPQPQREPAPAAVAKVPDMVEEPTTDMGPEESESAEAEDSCGVGMRLQALEVPRGERPEVAAVILDRAADLGVQPRLMLGLTVDAIQGIVDDLPTDAVEQCNAEAPLAETGQQKHAELNGYVNQFHAVRSSEVYGMSTCERFQACGADGVGVASRFVCWHLATPMAVLIAALRRHLQLHRAVPSLTHFWLSDFTIRHGEGMAADLAKLPCCVSAIRDTVLVLDSWEDPRPLRRTWCLKELYYTHQSEASLRLALEPAKQAAFTRALAIDLELVLARLAKVDIAGSESRLRADKESILVELSSKVGLEECQEHIEATMRQALLAEGRKALEQIPKAERGTSAMLDSVASMLRDQGELTVAEQLWREALSSRRGVFGEYHLDTLAALINLSSILEAQKEYEVAEPLCFEALESGRKVFGTFHSQTVTAMESLATVREALGNVNSALYLHRQALEARRKALGRVHEDVALSLREVARILAAQGDYAEAADVTSEELAILREKLGERHVRTLAAMRHQALYQRELGNAKVAEELYREALSGSREMLGSNHKDTLAALQGLAAVLRARGDNDAALPLCREAAATSKEAFGPKHPETLGAASNLARLLRAAGDTVGASDLFKEVLEVQRESLGSGHPDTLSTAYSLAGVLEMQGRLEEALGIYKEELQGCIWHWGKGHRETKASASKVVELLRSLNRPSEAEKVLEDFKT